MHPATEEQAAFASSVQCLLDAHTVPAALLGEAGVVVAANTSWQQLSRQQGGLGCEIGSNYFRACEDRNANGDGNARSEAEAIAAVLSGADDERLVENLTHWEDHARRVLIRATRLIDAGQPYAQLTRRELATSGSREMEQQSLSGPPQRQASQLEALAAASVEIAAAGAPEATLQAITDQARLIIGAHLGATHSIASNSWPEASVAVSLSEKYANYRSFSVPPNGSGIYAEVVRLGRSLRLDREQLAVHPAWRNLGRYKAEHPPLGNLLAVPMTGRDGVSIGVSMLSDKEDGEFTSDDEAILAQLAQIASVCIRNALDARAHRDAEERLAATQEHANIAIGECDAEGRYVRVISGFTALTGYAQDEILARTFFDFTDPADLEAERERHQRQLEGHARAYTSEKRFQHKDGSTRWALLSASAVFDAAGRFLYAIRVLQDITLRKRAEEHLAFQVRELHHRVRNTLATVQGIMGATARASGDIESFKRAFSGRLASIARAHTLLTTDDWQTAPLCALIEAEIDALEPHIKDQITADGPPVDLPASIAIPLSMALHELADNALRYGALATVDGQVAISWSIIETNESDVLALHWCERGGPSVAATVEMGYGRTLLTKVLPAQAKALVSLNFEGAGVSFQISAPLGQSRREP